MSTEIPVASEQVRDEWLRRVEAEYRSAALAQHLTLWLIQLGAPPELIDQGLAIVRDELKHARLSFDVFRAAGGEGAPRLIQESLQLARTDAPLEEDLFANNLRTMVLGETVAVRLFKRLRQHCDVPVARAALDVILTDEVQHREFGWTVMHWLLAMPQSPRLRIIANDILAGGVAEVSRLYGGQDSQSLEAIPAGDRRWGLMNLANYREAVVQCLKLDYIPRFAEVGITLTPEH